MQGKRSGDDNQKVVEEKICVDGQQFFVVSQ